MDKSGKKCFPIEFKRTQDCRHTYQERATDRAEEQYRSLLVGLQAIGERKGWQVQQLVFVGGTCASVEESTYNDNMKLLEVPDVDTRDILRQLCHQCWDLRSMPEQLVRRVLYFGQRDSLPHQED